MSDTAKLMPCPFCNEPPVVYSRGGAWGSKCAQSHHYVQAYGKTRDDAIAAWNRRAPDTTAHAEIERLREALAQACGIIENCAVQITTLHGVDPVVLNARAFLAARSLSQAGERKP